MEIGRGHGVSSFGFLPKPVNVEQLIPRPQSTAALILTGRRW